MRTTTVLGFLLSIVILFVVLFSKENLYLFINLQGILITLGGTISATLINYPISHLQTTIQVLPVVFSHSVPSPQKMIPVLVEWAAKARLNGFLALEQEVVSVKTSFLSQGIEFIADGTDPQIIREVMESRISSTATKYSISERVLKSMGSYAPMFGLMGTLIGLIRMLGSLRDPESIPPAMAVALVTTFYGVVLAGLVFNPLAGKVRLYGEAEILEQQITLEGLLSIQAGSNSLLVQEKLEALAGVKTSDRIK